MLHPRKHWHRSPAPRLARQKKSPLCATIARLSPGATGLVPPTPGLPHALSPIKGPTVAAGWLAVVVGGHGKHMHPHACTLWCTAAGGCHRWWVFYLASARARGTPKPWDPPGCPSWGDLNPQGCTCGWAQGLRQEPTPGLDNRVSSKQSPCKRRPEDPSGCHPGVRAERISPHSHRPFSSATW